MSPSRPPRSPARLALTAALIAASPALAACGEDARAGVAYYDAPTLSNELLTVDVYDGTVARQLRGGDIGGNRRGFPEFATARRGTLRVWFRFADGAVVASEGEVSVPLRGDWRWGFAIQVDSLDPRRLCFGCVGSRAFPLAAAYRRTPSDSVWVTWGGNSITNPVVY